MDMGAAVIVMAAIFVWGAVSARLERADLTAPIVFAVIGALLAWLALVDAPTAPEQLRPLVELTLVWVLFSDAARVPVQDLREDAGRCVRLLAVGLPLTMLLGWALAAWLFPGFDVWLALLVAAALAPTDAALGVPVVTNPVVPSRVRRLITVESGLNDGIATPVVMLAIAGAASAEGARGAVGLGAALAELTIGALVGLVVCFAGGWLLRWARQQAWASEDFTGPAVLALAVAGLRHRPAAARQRVHRRVLRRSRLRCGGRPARAERGGVPRTGERAGVAAGVARVRGRRRTAHASRPATSATLLYAVLSLTVVRMLPVALASVGAGLDRGTVLFVGWFGPRGLASLVFALLALEELGPAVDEAVSSSR